MGATELGQPCQQEQQPGRRRLEGPDFARDFAVQSQTHAPHHRLLVNIETGATRVNDFHQSLPSPDRAAGVGTLSMNSHKQAPGALAPRGIVKGAQGPRVQLRNGLRRTKERPTSVPTTAKPYHSFMHRGSAARRWGTHKKLWGTERAGNPPAVPEARP